MNELFLKLKFINEFWKIVSSRKGAGNFITSNIVREFEKRLSKFFNAKYIFGVASGTDALILALKACDIDPGDEVIVPAVSFFSTASTVAWVNAKPVFVDVELNSFNIDPNLVERAVTPKTKAIIAVHLNGRIDNMEKISAIAKKHNLFLIEDAAQAIGSQYKNQHPGYYGDIACLSFNPSKILTGGGDGGAIIANNKTIADKIALLRMYGTNLKNLSLEHYIIGTTSRLSPFHAAVMNVLMDDLDKIIAKQRENYFLCSQLLSGIGDLVLPSTPQDSFINGYRYVILTKKRDELHEFLRENGMASMIQYGVPLPYFKAFEYLGHKKGDFPVAEKIATESLVLPTDYNLTKKEITEIAALIKNFFRLKSAGYLY